MPNYVNRGLSFKLLESFFSNRKQVTLLNGPLSNLKNASCRATQGSTLGPLFFLLYVNVLLKCTNLCNSIAGNTRLFIASTKVSLLKRC